MSLHQLVNGIAVPLTEAEIADMNQRELAHAQELAELAKTSYKRERAAAYPSIPDQLDMIFHEGLSGWQEMIQAVKDAHPKPEES